jgi:hypothetical protein
VRHHIYIILTAKVASESEASYFNDFNKAGVDIESDVKYNLYYFNRAGVVSKSTDHIYKKSTELELRMKMTRHIYIILTDREL